MPAILFNNWVSRSSERQKIYKSYLARADKNSVLRRLPELHDEAVAAVNCTKCANCCKSYSPRFKTPDIKRIARHLRMKEGDFIDKYLNLDEEGDYVVKSTPCPFLDDKNLCSIYDERPSDCARFPYTGEDVMIKRQSLTLKNSTFCPIVYHVLERLLETDK